MIKMNEGDDSKELNWPNAEKEVTHNSNINASDDFGMESRGRRDKSREGKGTTTRIHGVLPTDSLARSISSPLRETKPADSLGTKERKDASTQSPVRRLAAENLKTPLVNTTANVIVEIPEDATEGELFYISNNMLDRAHLVAIKVPPREYLSSGVGPGNATRIRYMKIVIPPQYSPESSLDTEDSMKDAKLPSMRCSPQHQNRRKSSRQRALELKQAESENLNIGPNFQALPSQIPNPSPFQESASNNELYEQIWDPKIIETFSQHEQNEIYYVLDNMPTNQKEIMMESLHKCDYNLDMAWIVTLERLYELKSNGDLPGEPLPANVALVFHDSIWESRKDLVVATKTAQREEQISTCSLLVDYYGNYKPGKEYNTVKKLNKNESDYCQVCNDGGVLICCDECSATYHLACLHPPLESVPTETWLCTKCTSSEEKKEEADEDSNDRAPKRRKKQRESNVDPNWTYWGVNFAK